MLSFYKFNHHYDPKQEEVYQKIWYAVKNEDNNLAIQNVHLFRTALHPFGVNVFMQMIMQGIRNPNGAKILVFEAVKVKFQSYPCGSAKFGVLKNALYNLSTYACG
jgi:hypothetical protein